MTRRRARRRRDLLQLDLPPAGRPSRDPRLQQRHLLDARRRPSSRRSYRRASGAGVGATSADGRFTLLPIVCLGACDHAPALMIDGDLHADVDPDAGRRAAGEVSLDGARR